MDECDKRLTFVGTYGDVEFYKYSPSLLKPYYTDYPQESHPDYEKHTAHKIRMLLEYIFGGYSVYYMFSDGEVAGHIVIANGGRRLTVSTKEDVVLGPIFISPDMRGRGFGTLGIKTLLNDLELEYRYAYEFIAESNIASIRTAEKTDMSLFVKPRKSDR